MFEREGSHVAALFGLGDADGRDTHTAVRAGLVSVRARAGPSSVSARGPVARVRRRPRAGTSSVSAGVHVARILVDAQGGPVKDERVASLVATAQALARA